MLGHKKRTTILRVGQIRKLQGVKNITTFRDYNELGGMVLL